MHRYTALVCFSAILSGLPLLAVAAPVQNIVPADSFIAQHVATTGQLHQQISLDPVVRRRLARHFHTSAPAITHYIQNNLVLKKLTRAQNFRVYCISRDGHEYTINSRLAAGTPVFVMRSTGQPVLKLACGNPMVAALPPVTTKVAAYHSPEVAPVAAPAEAAIAPLLSSNGPVVVAMNDVPGVVVMPTTKVGGFLGQLPAVHAGGGGFPLGFLAAIPVAVAVASHHGGSTPSVGTTGTGATGTTSTGTTGTTSTGTTGTTSTGTTGTTGTGTTGTTGTGTTGTTGTGTTGTTGTGTTDTGTTGTGTTGTGTTGTGTTGTDTNGTGTDTSGTGTDTNGTDTSGTGTDTLGTNTGTDTNGNTSTGNTGTTTTGTTGTGTDTSGTGTDTLGTNTGPGVSPVPEPSAPAAFAVGGLFLLFLLTGAKRRRKA